MHRPRAGRGCARRAGTRSVGAPPRALAVDGAAAGEHHVARARWPARVSPSRSWVVPTTLTRPCRGSRSATAPFRSRPPGGRRRPDAGQPAPGPTCRRSVTSRRPARRPRGARSVERPCDSCTCGCRLSTTTQRSADPARRSARAHPMKPAPPVTSTLETAAIGRDTSTVGIEDAADGAPIVPSRSDAQPARSRRRAWLVAQGGTLDEVPGEHGEHPHDRRGDRDHTPGSEAVDHLDQSLLDGEGPDVDAVRRVARPGHEATHRRQGVGEPVGQVDRRHGPDDRREEPSAPGRRATQTPRSASGDRPAEHDPVAVGVGRGAHGEGGQHVGRADGGRRDGTHTPAHSRPSTASAEHQPPAAQQPGDPEHGQARA